jgi:hypothetical protein
LVGFGGQFGPNYEVAKLQTAADANDSHWTLNGELNEYYSFWRGVSSMIQNTLNSYDVARNE